MKTQIVVLGGGYAGMLASLRLSGKIDPDQAAITLINASDTFVEKIRLHQLATNQSLKRHTIRKLIGNRPINFKQGWVTALDLDARKVKINTADREEIIGYDYLIYSLGSIPSKNTVPGIQEHALAIADAKDAKALAEKLAQSSQNSRVLVVGGGLTGIETATEIAETYPALNVGLVTDGQIGSGLSKKGQTYLARVFDQLNIQTYTQHRIQAIEDGHLMTTTGHMLAFDTCVWAGSFSVPSLAREAGFDIDKTGRIKVDAYLRSVSHPNVYAAGDAAILMDNPLRMACAVAMPLGAHVADNVAALVNQQPQQPIGFDFALQCISLGRRRALVQMVNRDDSPQERIITGTVGAFIKEAICTYTTWSLNMERRFPGIYRWPGKNSQKSQDVGQLSTQQPA